MRRLFNGVALAMLVAWTLPVWGEVVELKDGSKIEGKITFKSGTEILANTEGIEVKINADEVKTIDGMPFTCDYKALYEQKSQEIGLTDVQGHYGLALWCKEHKLKEQMNAELDRVLSLDPGHEGANTELGKLFAKGQWRTPEELKKLGFVKKNGQWMTPDEASQAEGKVQYMGNWVRPEDVKRFDAQRITKYTSTCRGPLDMSTQVPTTFAIHELNDQLRRIELLNMWKPTPDQLKRMWQVLNEAEADRQMFIAKLTKAVPEVEAAWIALRNEALRGVVDSFDQDPEVEHRAGSGSSILGGLKKGKAMKLYNTHAEKFLAVLTPTQKDVLYNKYCTQCHSASWMKGGFGKEIRGTQAGVDFLERVRALPEDEFNKKMCDLAQEALKKFGKGPQTLLGKKTQRAGKRSSQDMDAEEMTMADIMKRSRVAPENEWARTRFNFSAEIEAPNQEERLKAIQINGCKEKGSFLTNIEVQGMVVEALFDGTLRDVVAMKLGIPRERMVVKAKAGADVSAIPEFKDGATAVQVMCTACHTIDRINKTTKSPEGWRSTVQYRLHQGVSEDTNLINLITDYLVSRSGGQQKVEAK